MNLAEHISQEDLALFALQMLPEGEAAAVLAHVRECESCRKEVAAYQGDLALYSLSTELQALPAHAEERFLRRIAEEPRRAAAKQAARPAAAGVSLSDRVTTMPRVAEQRPRGMFVPYLGWALAAMFAAAAGLQFQQGRRLKNEVTAAEAQIAASQTNATNSQTAISTLTDPAAMNVTLRQPAAHGTEAAPQGHAAYLPDRGALVFVATNLEPLKPYKVYELWLLPVEKNAAPIPAASFKPDATGKATVILPAGPKLVEVKGFGVTQEDDASALKQPTLPILLVGTSKS